MLFFWGEWTVANLKLLIYKLGTFGQSWCNFFLRNTNTLLPSSGQNLNCTWAGIIHYGLSLACQRWRYKKNIKKQLFFSLYELLPDLLCFILLHSFRISTNFKVFPFKWYQEYAYPCHQVLAVRFGDVILGSKMGRKKKRGGSLRGPILSWVDGQGAGT